MGEEACDKEAAGTSIATIRVILAFDNRAYHIGEVEEACLEEVDSSSSEVLIVCTMAVA